MSVYGSGLYGAGPYAGYSYATELASFTCEPLVLIEIALPSGTKYYAGTPLHFYGQAFEGKILGLSNFRRSLAQNLGLFEVSSIDVAIADTDASIVQLADTDRIKNVAVTFKLGTKRIPLGLFSTFHEGKIDDFGSGNFGFRILVRDRLWTLPSKPDIGVVGEDNFPYALPGDIGKVLPVCYGTHSYTGSGAGEEENALNRGAWPTLFVDVQTSARTFLIARHAVKSIDNVYAWTPGRGSVELTATTHYVAYPAGTLDGQTMAYIQITQTGWDNMVTDTSGNLGTVTVNVQGKDDQNTGAGESLTNPIDVLEDLFDNYLGGAPLNVTEFSRAQAVAKTRGYTVSGGIVDGIATDKMLKEISDSFSIRIYPDSNGQIAVDIFQPEGPTVTARSYKEQWHILKASLNIGFESDVQGAEDAQIINYVDYAYEKHYARGHYASTLNVQAATSIATYGEQRLVLELPWNGSDGGAKDVAQRYIFLYQDPVATITFKTPAVGMLSDLTDQIDVTHAGGHISGGYDDRRFEIIEHIFNPSDFTVDIRAKDVDKLVANAFFLGDSDANKLTGTGTAGVTNGDATVTITSGPADLSAVIQASDHCWFVDPTNEANLLHVVVAAPITTTTFEAEDSDGTPITGWVNESGISYVIVPSWLTASTALKKYGFLCDSTTGQFSNGDPGKRAK